MVFPVHRREIVEGAEDFIFLADDLADAVLEFCFIDEIGDAEGGGAVHLVGVAWADAATGGADGGAFGALLSGGVFLHVVRHDEMGFVTDAEIGGGDGDATGGEGVDFAEEDGGVEDDAVADDVHFSGA